jgi:hypothetical protein
MQLHPTDVYPSFNDEGYPAGFAGADPVEFSALALIKDAFSDAASPAESTLTRSTSDSMQSATDVDEPSIRQEVPVRRQSELVRFHRSPPERRASVDAIPSVSILPSFLYPSIPPNPWIPLSFLGDDNLQVQISEADATDMDMRS